MGIQGALATPPAASLAKPELILCQKAGCRMGISMSMKNRKLMGNTMNPKKSNHHLPRILILNWRNRASRRMEGRHHPITTPSASAKKKIQNIWVGS